MIVSLALTCILAMFLYALFRKAWIAIAVPTVIGLVWLASHVGAFRPAQGDSTVIAVYVGFLPLSALAYGAASLLGVAIAGVLSGVVERINRR